MAEKAKFEGEDKRQRYRLGTETKILVVGKGKPSQVGTIVNMTRTGVFFQAFGDYFPGMELQVTFPYEITKPAEVSPQRAEVVRVQDIEGSLKKGVAVKLTNLFLKA